jgi:hypothetical protein
MKIQNLDPKRYKRFFAFGCSFTSYYWPSWADIIGQDIPIYENWAERGAGNHFIFNSVMEAHARHNFTKDDLVIVMWSTKEREDRYYINKWLHDTTKTQEKTYGKDWFKKFGTDVKSFLIRDLAYIKSIQTFLDSCECDWENFTMHPITNIDHDKVKQAGININALSEKEKFNYWVTIFDKLCDGHGIDPLIEFKDIIEIYSDVFLKINKSLEGRWSYEHTQSRLSPNNDLHPTPIEALKFLDTVWPDNKLSTNTRIYAAYWNNEIFKYDNFKTPIHPTTTITRF